MEDLNGASGCIFFSARESGTLWGGRDVFTVSVAKGCGLLFVVGLRTHAMSKRAFVRLAGFLGEFGCEWRLHILYDGTHRVLSKRCLSWVAEVSSR